ACRRPAGTAAAASEGTGDRSPRGDAAPHGRRREDSSRRLCQQRRDTLGVSRCAYLNEEAMGFAEFALTGSLVAAQAREFCRDLMDDRLSAARLRLVDQCGGLREGALHLGCATRTLGAEQGSRARQQGVHLEEAAAA